jgi:hypothetical protein
MAATKFQSDAKGTTRHIDQYILYFNSVNDSTLPVSCHVKTQKTKIELAYKLPIVRNNYKHVTVR